MLINSSVETASRFIEGLPKAELHVHIEGTLEPELLLKIAKRNALLSALEGYDGDDKAFCEKQRAKRKFNNLQEFLDLYYAGCDVLRTEEDFYELCFDYLKVASANNVLHAEIFFDPQTHTHERNRLDLSVVINGLHRACLDAEQLLVPPVRASLILCFLRHRHEQTGSVEAVEILNKVFERGLDSKIVGIGLDSGEIGNRPSIFKQVFALAKQKGLHCVAHAGEEGDWRYIDEAVDTLGVERIDHGVRCLEHPPTIEKLKNKNICLTVCPCSNHRLKVVQRYFKGENPVKRMLDHGLNVCLNGDDPAYFFGHQDKFGEIHGGYINSNYVVALKEAALSADEVVQIALNSFHGSFISENEKQRYAQSIADYCTNFDP